MTRVNTASTNGGPSSTVVTSGRLGTRASSRSSSDNKKHRPRSVPKTPKTPSYVWTMGAIGSQSLPIFDPDYPDETPLCNSPRPPPKRDYFEVAALHDAREAAAMVGGGGGLDLDNLSGIEEREKKLTVSEISVFGTVGDLEDTFGPELPILGLCTCGGSRVISRACPLHRGEKEQDHDGASVRSSRTH